MHINKVLPPKKPEVQSRRMYSMDDGEYGQYDLDKAKIDGWNECRAAIVREADRLYNQCFHVSC